MRIVATITLLLLVDATLAQNLVGHVEEVLHKNSIPNYGIHPARTAQRRNSKAMSSFIDYFFPPSRSAKVASNFNNSTTIDASTAKSTQENIEETTLPMTTLNEEEARATGSTKKGTTAKRKNTTSSRVTNTTPKTKNQRPTEQTKQTQKPTTTRPVVRNTSKTTGVSSTTSSQKTTHKHYTIHPTIVKSNPTTYKTKQAESSTTQIDKSTTATISQQNQFQKVTLADLAKVSESATENVKTTSLSDTGSTNIDGREGELELKDKQQASQEKNETISLPNVLAKPTKYHYYPHNQHIYLLPECAIQQVCNAVYVRLNYTQPLCACPARHRDPCSASLNADDMHTTQLTTNSKKKYSHKAITLVKTCEAITEMRECRAPRDWSLLALQNIRTGKSHYLVICRCPEEFILEGPMSHDQPTYASVPGIRVYGMMCVQPLRNQYTSTGYNSITGRPTTNTYKVGYSQPHYNQEQSFNRYPSYAGPGAYYNRMARRIRDTRNIYNAETLPSFPWEKVRELALTADWEN